MTGREWKPGDVAMVTTASASFVAARDADNDGWNRLVGLSWHADRLCKDARPLVVIDPEDREQVERLTDAWFDLTDIGSLPARMAEALRSLVTPPKPEVFEHLATGNYADGIATALCGKVWRPTPDVTIKGRCPECRQLSVGGWVA